MVEVTIELNSFVYAMVFVGQGGTMGRFSDTAKWFIMPVCSA
jgi:hypothetical protein